MEGEGRKALVAARWIVTLMYVVPLVVFPMVGRMVKTDVSLDGGALRVLAGVLAIVGLGDYVLSLVLERSLLARARENAGAAPGQHPVVTAALIVGAFGACLAVYGLVLALLGAPSYGSAFYVLCAAHGLHLLVRWPSYVRAAEAAPC